MKRFFKLLVVIAVLLAGISGLRYWGKPTNNPREVFAAPADPLRSPTAMLEEELAKELQLRARGLATDDDVDFARVNLAKARHDTAMLTGNRVEMVEQYRLILGIREREWQRVGPAIERGIISQAEADDVRRRLAVARFRLADLEKRDAESREQLRLVADICDRQAQRRAQAYAQRTVSLRELNAARYRATCARYMLAKAGGVSDDIRREIDRAVTMWEGEAERVGRLYETRATSYFDSYHARFCLFDARLRRATFAENRDKAAEQLRLRIALAEEGLPRLDPTDPFLRRQRPMIEWFLATDRQALERLQKDGMFPPDSAAAQLDG